MSDALSIAAVTAGLAQIIRSAAKSVMSGAEVLTERPGMSATLSPHINLFLFGVFPNAAIRNPPLRLPDSRMPTRPPVALNLQYLLTFYGNEAELEPQRMLGAVVRDLQAKPIITHQMIQDAITNLRFLSGSNLASLVEPVKITHLVLSLEQISKIWSIFLQIPYALSIAYECGIVLIESEEPAQPILGGLRP